MLTSLNATLKTQTKDMGQQLAKKNADMDTLQAQLKSSTALVAELTTANKTLKQTNIDAAAANAREKAATKAANTAQLAALENTHKQAMKTQANDSDAKTNKEMVKKDAIAKQLQVELDALRKTVADVTRLKDVAEATQKSDAAKLVALEKELQLQLLKGVDNTAADRVSDLETQLDNAKKVLDTADAKLIVSMSGAVAAKGTFDPF